MEADRAPCEREMHIDALLDLIVEHADYCIRCQHCQGLLDLSRDNYTSIEIQNDYTVRVFFTVKCDELLDDEDGCGGTNTHWHDVLIATGAGSSDTVA